MTAAEKPKPKRTHPWRAHNPGWLARDPHKPAHADAYYNPKTGGMQRVK